MERVPLESSKYTGPKRTLSLEPLEQRLLLQADWTFMVYLDGDNNLESAAVNDFLEMAHVGSTANVNVVAQFDRSPLDQSSGGAGYTNSYGNWSDTRRGLVAKDDMPNTSWGTSIGEADMGAPSTLQDFLTWAVTNYQANHYAVILWDHGNGFGGVEFDDTDGSFLTMSDLSSAMSGALTATGVSKFDLLNFDGCNMNMAEVANQVEDLANVLVGSEDVEPLDGLPYDQVLGSLTATPLMAATELGNTMAQDYQTYYSSTFGGNYSVIDLTEMGPLSAALSNFGTTFMNDGNATDRYQLSQHWQTAPRYISPDGGFNNVDIGVLMTDVSGDSLMSQSVRNAANDVLSVYSYTVLYSYASPLSQGSGLSIYMPDNTGTVDPDYNGGNLSFAANTQWDEFLNGWTGTQSATWTYMIYMGADTNLEPDAITDFLEMASVGSTDAVNIVVQLDRSAGYDTSYGDWTDTRRGLVSQGDVPDTSWGASIGEADMGDPNALADFINWAIVTYPAQHYALTLWDHGDGLNGAIFDDNNGLGVMDNLTVQEMDQGLEAVPNNIDVLDFTACDMSLLEVAYQVRNEASYMVGSEDLYWGVTGLGGISPWDQIFAQLTANPSMSPLQVAKLTASEYFNSWSVGNLTVMKSVVDLSRAGALANAVDDLAQAALNSGTTEDRVLMEQHRVASPSYPNPNFAGPDIYRDLGTWLDGLVNDANISNAITQAASVALGAYDSAVVANYATPGAGTGLAIYMPGELPDGTYNWQEVDFAGDTQWPEFLAWWAANVVSPIATFQSGSALVSFYDVYGIQDIDPSNIQVKLSGTNVKSIVLGGMNPMRGLGIVISGATSVGTIKDARTNPGEIAFIASNTGAKSVQVNSPIAGDWLNGRSLGGVIFPSDIDGDGNPYDTTSLYFGGGVGKLQLNASVRGGAFINGPVKSFQLNSGDLLDDFLIMGSAGKIQFTGMNWGYVWTRFYVGGGVKKLDMADGTIAPDAIVDIGGYVKQADIGYIMAGGVSIIDPLDNLAAVPLATFDPSTFNFFYTRGATLRVGDGIGKLNVSWFTPGSITYDDQNGGDLIDPPTGTDQRYFITYLMSNVLTPSIGRFDVEWGVAHARILAGADLGADRLPGGTGANADSYGVGYIGKIRIGTVARKAGLYIESYIAGGTEPIEYSGGSVGDSLIAAGLFESPNTPALFSGLWGGSGYNLVSQHDNYLFEDGSYIGKIDVVGNVVSRYNELEAAGDDFSTDTPPLYPYFVPFGVGSYMIGSASVLGAPVSPVATLTSFGMWLWPRHAYFFVELPRGLGANG